MMMMMMLVMMKPWLCSCATTLPGGFASFIFLWQGWRGGSANERRGIGANVRLCKL